jgi:hypothetical protein
MTEARECRICGVSIPPARLKAMPTTEVCVACSENIGGEFEIEVKISNTGKPGSLKKTGQDVQVRVKPRNMR